MKRIVYYVLAVIGALLLVGYCYNLSVKVSDLKQSLIDSHQNIKTDTVTNSKQVEIYNASMLKQLSGVNSEYKALKDELEAMSLKLSRINQVTKEVSYTTQKIIMPVKDSLVWVHDMPHSEFITSYHDPWLSLVAIKLKDSLQVNYNLSDTIHSVIYREPKKFLWFKFGTKSITQKIWGSNPNTKYNIVKSIELKK